MTGHQQAVSDLTQQYNSPLNALTALQSGSQVSQPGVGQVASTAQTGIQPANYAGLVEQNYQSQLQSSNASMGGLFGLGGSLLGAAGKNWGGMGMLGSIGSFVSDENLKTDIQKLGEDPETGLDMYAYRYKGDPKNTPKVVGPMAQDIEKLHPEMVREVGGRKIVQPDGAVGRLFGLGGELRPQGGLFGLGGELRARAS